LGIKGILSDIQRTHPFDYPLEEAVDYPVHHRVANPKKSSGIPKLIEIPPLIVSFSLLHPSMGMKRNTKTVILDPNFPAPIAEAADIGLPRMTQVIQREKR
jgi:hypothetical protein